MAEDRKLGASGVALGACGGCALIVIIGIIFLYIAATKTGLVGKSESIPEPSRTVEVGDSTLDSVKTDLVASVLRSLKNGEAQVVVSEEMLTSILRDDLADVAAQEGLDFTRAQVAITNEQLEFYLPIEQDGKKTALTMLITPVLTDGDIHLDLTEARLGTLKAPGFVTQVPENLINDAINKQLETIEDSFELTSLTFEEGSMTLSGKVSIKGIPGF
ncbi:hypothetical protein HOI83_04170 [Candidatus Uhrbacteria bacterium]|jgi:hypothetical protein|nr:hypothetical protein [Candidatus Uhrbacteria bacterium]